MSEGYSVVVESERPVAAPAAPVVTQNRVSPSSLLAMAIERNASLEYLERLMALQERHEANEARKLFVEAMARFKAEPLAIVKSARVYYESERGGSPTEYWHATLSDVTDVVVPAMAKHGLSHRWSVEQQDGRVHVTCVVTHQAGHSEMVKLDAAPDPSGKKNPIQQLGSAINYLQRYSLLAILGLSTKNATEDDDGAATGQRGGDEKGPRASEEDLATLKWMTEQVNEAKTDDRALELYRSLKVKIAHNKALCDEWFDIVVARRTAIRNATKGDQS